MARVEDPATALLTELYEQHYRSLLRLAVLCVDDRALAEDVVHDAYIAVHQARLRDPGATLAYLRRAVVNQGRSRLRKRQVAVKYLPRLAGPPSEPARGNRTDDRELLRAALAELPTRQREAVVLRHYADLSEKQTAEAMGISVGAVKSNCSRGIAALNRILKENR